jgi:hypothetical protein
MPRALWEAERARARGPLGGAGGGGGSWCVGACAENWTEASEAGAVAAPRLAGGSEAPAALLALTSQFTPTDAVTHISTICCRALALKQISNRDVPRVVLKEAGAGCMMGACGREGAPCRAQQPQGTPPPGRAQSGALLWWRLGKITAAAPGRTLSVGGLLFRANAFCADAGASVARAQALSWAWPSWGSPACGRAYPLRLAPRSPSPCP